VQTIQLTAQVDPDGVLRVQLPDDLKNTMIEATIVFTSTENIPAAWMNRDRAQSLANLTADDRISWAELVHSLAGAWAEDFPSLVEIRTGAVDLNRESL
jgi:hypothetical protein